jgi:hypothetical protein
LFELKKVADKDFLAIREVPLSEKTPTISDETGWAAA